MNYINRRIKGFVVAIVFLMSFFMISSGAFAYTQQIAGYVGWVGTFVTPANFIYNQSAALLPVGSLLQVISVGQNGSIDLPKADGTPGGDDYLITHEACGFDYQFGNFTSAPGMYYDVYQATWESTWGSPKVYVRAWNGTDTTNSTYYGNSSLITPTILPAPVPPFDPANFPANFSTTTPYTPPAGTPVITTVSPVAGGASATVTISGSSFGLTQGSGVVQFDLNGSSTTSATSYTSWNDTQIVFTVPSMAAGKYRVIVRNNSSQNGYWSTYYHLVPYIYSISPISGPLSTVVTVVGSNLATATNVNIDSTLFLNASPIGPTATQLTFNLDPSTPTGPSSISIDNPSGTSNQVTFTVTTTGPQITGVKEINGGKYYIGHSYITVEGTGFGATQGSSTVQIGGYTMTPSVWSDTKITGLIPTSIVTAESKNVVVNAGTASNSFSIVCYPYITGLSAASQMAGTSITITGYGFGASQGTSTSFFNGTVGGTAISWVNTSIVMNVPMTATSGLVSVEVNPGGLSSNGVNLTVTANTNAYISSITQATIYSGDALKTITVHGTNTTFTSGTVAYVQYITGTNVSCPISVSNGTTATVTLNVPANTVITAGSKRITLVTGAELATGDASVAGTAPVVITAPTVSTFSQAAGDQGSQVTASITGTGSHFNLTIGTQIVVSGTGVTAEVVAPAPSTTSMSIKFYIDGSAAATARTVTLSYAVGALGTETFSPAFTVNQGAGNWSTDDFVSNGGPMVAYPNPFNPLDTANPLKMLIGAATDETVSIYILDSNARIVWEFKGALGASRIVTWDGDTAYGDTAHNGLYLARAVSGTKTLSKGKILVINKKP
jgi:hypothetical protein